MNAFEQAFMGIPIIYKEVCFIYPPTNKEIAKTGYSQFLTLLSLLIKSQEDIVDELEAMLSKDQMKAKPPTPFEYLLICVNQSSEFKEMATRAFQFFTHEKPTFILEIPAIVIGDLSQKRMLTADNFFEFQNLIRESIGAKPIEPPDPNEHPKVAYFKAKQRKRDRVKAKKSGSVEFITLLTSVCCAEAGVTPMTVGDLTYAAMNLLIARSQLKEVYDTNMRSILAGADPKKVKIEYWIKDIKND